MKNTDVIRVFVIDDDEDDFFFIKDLLADVRRTKYDVRWISNYEAALVIVPQQEADVYIVDYHWERRRAWSFSPRWRGKPVVSR